MTLSLPWVWRFWMASAKKQMTQCLGMSMGVLEVGLMMAFLFWSNSRMGNSFLSIFFSLNNFLFYLFGQV